MSVSNTKLLVCVSMRSQALLRPIYLTCYICRLLLALSTRPRTHVHSEFNDTNVRPMVSVLFLIWVPTSGIFYLMISKQTLKLAFSRIALDICRCAQSAVVSAL